MSFRERVILDITNKCITKELEGLDAYGVFYGDVLLWTTHPYSLDPKNIKGYEIAMVDEGGDHGIRVIGTVPVVNMENEFDIAHYGYWTNERDALNWLENPTDIVKDKEDSVKKALELLEKLFGIDEE